MAAIIHQKDKRSGITYAYKSISYWDKEKKQSRAKRHLIGRVDEKTGEIVPTDGRMRRKKEKETQVPPSCASRTFCGATYLLDAIGRKIGVSEDLKACFPKHWKQILSIAYYLILEESGALFRFEKWSLLHRHPYGRTISSQRSSELFASVTEDARRHFFTLQGRRREEKEYWAYDTTSISSYSQQLRQVQYGYNKEHDPLPQINLAVVFGEDSKLPFYYRKLAGNIPDTRTLKPLLADLRGLGFAKLKLVMDRGFYSKENIDALYKEHLKFLISARISLRLVRKHLDSIYERFRHHDAYLEEYELYSHTVRTAWDYEEYRPYKGDTIHAKKRIYIHYYYNIEKAAQEEKEFDRKIRLLRNELRQNQRKKEHEKLYGKYFTLTQTPKRGIRVEVKEEVLIREKRYLGFFALLSNEKMDAVTALQTYRNKDLVEKAFGNLKERLNLRRALVSNEKSLEGKLFVQFVALIYLSYIKRQMQARGLFGEYTLQTLLDRLDVIECLETPGSRPRFGEILKKQKKLYEAMGVEVPGGSL